MVATGAGARMVLAIIEGQVADPGDFAVDLNHVDHGVPFKLGKWQGEDRPLDENIVEATDTDQHVNRIYREEGTTRAVNLFVAFGTRMRDMVPHRPQVCYPGGGWNHVYTHEREIETPDGQIVPCQIHNFKKGVFDLRKRWVLNYYLLSGRYLPDVGKLRRRIVWSAEPSYVVQVQITGHPDPLAAADGGRSTERMLLDFGAAAAADIRKQFPREVKAGAP